MKLIREQIEKAETLDFDYYTCRVCGEEQVNVVAGDFPCCWCNNGCDFHGDIFFSPGRKLPKKVKEILIRELKKQELIDDALVVYKLSGCRP